MPIYKCYVQEGTVPAPKRAELARMITETHVQATDAPAGFMHVFFMEIPRGSGFTGGKTSRASVIEATHRAGRSLETRQRILVDISHAWSRITGQAETDLMISIAEADARSGMEGGFILPEPGSKADWPGTAVE